MKKVIGLLALLVFAAPSWGQCGTVVRTNRVIVRERVAVVEVVQKLPVNAYSCQRGHLTLTADHGNSAILEADLWRTGR